MQLLYFAMQDRFKLCASLTGQTGQPGVAVVCIGISGVRVHIRGHYQNGVRYSSKTGISER